MRHGEGNECIKSPECLYERRHNFGSRPTACPNNRWRNRLRRREHTQGWSKPEKFARCVEGRPQLMQWFEFQEEQHEVMGVADTDWAECRKTRRSTTGGCLTSGKHALRCWAKTQAIIALSSGEAELYGAARVIALYADRKEGRTGKNTIMGGLENLKKADDDDCDDDKA